MPVESAADRATFLSADEFGVTATYTPAAGGDSSEINGIFDKEYVEINVESEAAVAGTHPMFHCRTADLTDGGSFDDTLVIDGTTYLAKHIRPDGTGMTQLFLEQQ